ncbi:MAG: hypothetical protein INR62_13065 [Rhodospirillales bacterium]|nr:hypothetical protein [Acetobacter sp.]
MNAGEKPLNAMNRLADMGHFPVAVNAGATVNVLAMIALTWYVQPSLPQPWAPVAWVALILVCNLLPVALLRLTLTESTTYPTLQTMNFWRDQHKFSDWVYVAASANMGFWILAAWAVFSARHTAGTLGVSLLVGFLATFSPVLLRRNSR